MKLGLYGGTFNPIHNGHMHLIRKSLQLLSLDQMILMPAYSPPHKEVRAALANAEDRFKLCQLAVEEFNRAGSIDHKNKVFDASASKQMNKVDVSDLEIVRKGKSYTIDTIEALKQQNTGAEIFLLMGEDMFLTVDTWYRACDIFSLCTLTVCPRSDQGLSELQKFQSYLKKIFDAKSLILEVPFLPISSTTIRELVGLGQRIDMLVPKTVEKYIKQHFLYR